MSNVPDNIYSELLSELERLKRNVQQDNVEKVKEWKEKVQSVLKGAYRVRFSKLRFYYEERSASSDDIPF